MLRPQDTATRERVCLDGIWNFALVEDAIGEDWTASLPASSTQVPVPASYNDILLQKGVRNHVGWVKYQRLVRVPRGWSQERYFIRSDAATHRGCIYINKTLVVDHQGGYTPFEADITSLVKAGEEFCLTIAVCNELSNITIPPGTIEVTKSGRKQNYFHDFYNYAGLARSVWLYSVPKRYISDVTVTTAVVENGAVGTIHYQLSLSDESALNGSNVKVTAVDETNQAVGESEGINSTIGISSPQLWQPGAAYLYKVQFSLYSASEGSIEDTYVLEIGIRTVEVKGSQFLINNKPFYFTGFGKHEDTPVRGKGHDPAYMVHDFQLMDWIGANSFRTSHYPYAEEVMEFANRHGIVVIDETAAVGLNLNITSGLWGDKTVHTFSPETMNDQTREAHAKGIRKLIARDKNYACVVMWSIANEPGSGEQGAREYFEPLTRLARELDSRPICFANFVLATPEKDQITDLFDVLLLNRYYGWYEHTGDFEMAETLLEEDLMSWQRKYGKPMIMGEYGADTLAGLHTVNATPWSEEFQAELLKVYHRVFDRVECVVGEHVWNFADFQTSSRVFRVDGNKKGVFTRDRRPKLSAQTLKTRWVEEGKGRHH